jgi:HEAT repeat protein
MISVKDLTKQLGSDDPAQAFKAKKTLTDAVMQAGKELSSDKCRTLAAELAEQLVAVHEDKEKIGGVVVKTNWVHPVGVRRDILWMLSYIADARQVPQLARALQDWDVREEARAALERNPSPKATEVLIEALNDQFGPRFRVGIVNTLARRGGEKAVTRLRQAVNDTDQGVILAAGEALSGFPYPEHDALIVKASKAVDCPRARNDLMQARVRLAENLAEAGKKSAAAKVYRAVQGSRMAANAQKQASASALKAM